MNRSSLLMAAENLHSKGNYYYQSQEYFNALIEFTASIQFISKYERNHARRNSKLKILYAKRSIVALKLSQFRNCLNDIQCALKNQENEDFVELKRLRRAIVSDVYKTDKNLTAIPEDTELSIKPTDLSEETFFDLDDSIMNFSTSDDGSLDESDDEDHGNESASLEDLLDECDDIIEHEITIENVIDHLSMIEDDDSSDSDTTLTDSTLKFTDFENNDSNFISDEDEV